MCIGTADPHKDTKMKRQVHNLITHLLPLLAFVLVGACSEVGAETEVFTESEAIIERVGQGDAFAQSDLGGMYYGGEGVSLDYNEAAKWLRKSAEQGHADAQAMLGVMYSLGQGVIKDEVKAYAWFNVSSGNGSEMAPKGRDAFALLITPGQIHEAQKLSREWFEKYQPKE